MEEDKKGDISKCRNCEGLDLRVQDGFFPDGKNKKYVNGEKLMWNGRRCPKCVKLKAKDHIKQKRKNAKPRDDSKN